MSTQKQRSRELRTETGSGKRGWTNMQTGRDFFEVWAFAEGEERFFCSLELNLLTIRKYKKTCEKRSMIRKDGFFSWFVFANFG